MSRHLQNLTDSKGELPLRLAEEAAEMRAQLCERDREPESEVKPTKLKQMENDGGQICKLDPKSMASRQWRGQSSHGLDISKADANSTASRVIGG